MTTARDGRVRYNLFYGSYPDLAQARAVLAELPPGLRASQPWVRKLGGVQQASR